MKVVPIGVYMSDAFRFMPRDSESVAELLAAIHGLGMSGEFFALNGQVRLLINVAGDTLDHLDPGMWLIVDPEGGYKTISDKEFIDEYRESGS